MSDQNTHRQSEKETIFLWLEKEMKNSPGFEGNLCTNKTGDQYFINLFIQQIFRINTVNAQHCA